MEILVSWIGDNDLKSLREGRLTGPVNSILKSRFSKSFDEVCLLYNNFRKAQSEDLIGYFKKEYDLILLRNLSHLQIQQIMKRYMRMLLKFLMIWKGSLNKKLIFISM